MSGSFKSFGGKSSEFLGLKAPKSEKIGFPSGSDFAGIITPGFSFTGNKQGQFELKRRGFDVEGAEAGLLGALEENRAGVAGLRSTHAPLRGGFAALQGQFPGLRDSSRALGKRVQGLLGQVQPGFGRLTESLVQGVRDREAASVGNLRSALAKRNVLGSSFAQRELQRTGIDFGQEEERVRSGAFEAELAASRGLIEDAGRLIELDAGLIESEAKFLGAQLGLTEFEAGLFAQIMTNIKQQQSVVGQIVGRQLDELAISGNISNGISAIIAAIATRNAEFAASAAHEEREQFGNTIGLIGSFGTSAFAPSGGGPAPI